MILILTQCFPPDIGGIENLMGGLADNLHRAGREVVVLADRIRNGKTAKNFAYPVFRFDGPRPLRRWLKYRKTKAIAESSAIEAVFTDSWKSVSAVPDLDAPIIVLAHGTELPSEPRTHKIQRIKRALSRAATIVPNSVYTAGRLREYTDEKARIEVIHPPIELPDKADTQNLSFLNIADDAPVLLTLARLEPRKGIDKVIASMPELREVFPNIVYLIGGGGEDRTRLESLALNSGVMYSVRFLGPITSADMKCALYERADLFVMPSRQIGNSIESFGISYIEAAWFGVPSVAGKDGGAGEAVQHGETGLVCDGSDQASVTHAIATLLKDDALRVKLGDAAARRVREELQWSQAIKRYLALIDDHAMERAG
ncbi:MAG TPA: glycosyltransferase family 4 protein [Hyphomicrobiales bacterium]|nr:glycosyltransferase family 4 protein [Hyphomicrobiales bacterium]